MNNRNRVLPEKQTGPQLVKICLVFYGTRRFIAAFTRPNTCPYSEPDQSIPCPNPTSWILILILSPIYAYVFQVVFFSQVSPQKPCFRLSCPPYVPHAPPITFIDHATNIWWGLHIRKLLAMNVSPLPCCLVSLRPKYLPQRPIIENPHFVFLSQCLGPILYRRIKSSVSVDSGIQIRAQAKGRAKQKSLSGSWKGQVDNFSLQHSVQTNWGV